MIKIIILLISFSACSSLDNGINNSNEFVINENNSAKDYHYNNK